MRPFRPLLGFCLAVSCATPDPGADRRAYLAGDCAAVSEPRLRQECWLFTVRAEPAMDTEICPRIEEDYLREECWFISVDARQSTGEAARQGCSRAGRYAGPCISNALSRELSIAEGKEADILRLERSFREILVAYHQPEAERQARDYALRILRRRVREHQECSAPPDWCAAISP